MEWQSRQNIASTTDANLPDAATKPFVDRESLDAKPSAIVLAAIICEYIKNNYQQPLSVSCTKDSESFLLRPHGIDDKNPKVIGQATVTLNSICNASPQDIPAMLKGLTLNPQEMDATVETIDFEIRNELNTITIPTIAQADAETAGTSTSGTRNKHEGLALAALVIFAQSGFELGQIKPGQLNAVLMGRTVSEWLSLFMSFWAHRGTSGSGQRAARQMVGRFKLVRLLGKGAFGEVHEAIDTSLGRTVAVKLPVSKNKGQQDWEYIRREAQLAAAIDHPNVVPLLEIGEHNGNPFLVSALIHGLSMKDWLADGPGTIPPKQAATWVAMAARGVQAIHDRGILHCDLKTGNIMLDEASKGKTGFATPRIMDFGLSGWNGEQGMDRDDGPMGTPATMAPEQLRGRAALTVRTDVYALGAILHELLFGENHHQATSIQAIFNRLESNAAPLPAPRPIPKDLDAIRIKCLSPLPEDRYHSAEEVSRDLELFLEGRAPVAVRATSIGQFKRLFLRRPVLIGSAMAVSVTLTLMASAGIVMAVQLELAKGAKREAELRASLEASKKDLLEQRQSLSEARVLLDSPKPDSVAQALALLSKLISANTDSSTIHEARSLALQAGLLPRIESLPQWGGKTRYYMSAWSPISDWLALSDPKGKLFLSSGIHFANASTDSVRESLAVPPSLAFQATKGRQDGVRSMAIAPTGRWLYAGTRSGFVHIYDLKNNKMHPQYSLDCKSDEIRNLFISDEGRTITCLSGDKVLVTIRGQGGKYLLTSRQPLAELPVTSMTITPENRLILMAMNDATIQARPLDDPGTIRAQGRNLGTSVFTLRDGTILRRHNNKLDICTINIFNYPGSQSSLELKPIVTLGNSKYWGSEFPPLLACAVHPSGSYIALLTNTGNIYVFEAFSGRLVCSWHKQGELVSLAFSPDGKYLAITGNSGAQMYGFQFPLLAIPVETGSLEPEVAWYGDDSPDPEVILFPRLDPDVMGTMVRLEGTISKKVKSGIEFLNSSNSVMRCNQNMGEQFFVPIKDMIRSKAPSNISGIQSPNNIMCYAIPKEDGHKISALLIGTDKGIIYVDATNNKIIAEWTNYSGKGIGRGGTNHLLTIGQRVLALGVDGTVRLFDNKLLLLKSWRIGQTALTHARDLPSSPEGSLQVAIGDEEGSVILLDLAKEEPLFSIKAHEGRVRRVASVQYGDDTMVFTAGLDGRIMAWKLDKDQLHPLGSVTIGIDAHVMETNGDNFVMAARSQTGVWKGKIQELIQLLAPKAALDQ